MAWRTNLTTMTNDIYPVRLIGSVSGIIAFGSGLGGVLFTNLTGFVVQHSSYTLIFIIMGFLHPVSYVVVRLLVKTPIVPSGIRSGLAHEQQRERMKERHEQEDGPIGDVRH